MAWFEQTQPDEVQIPKVPWVYQRDTKDFQEEINAEFPAWTNLERALNNPEICINQPLDSLAEKCDKRSRQLDATMNLLALQSNIEWEIEWADIDLLYDEVLDKYRYRLFNNDKLTLDINIDQSQITQVGEIIVKLLNNLWEIELENWSSQIVWWEYYSDLTVPHENWILSTIWVSSLAANTEIIMEIFNIEKWTVHRHTKANKILKEINDFMIRVNEFKEKRDQLNIKFDEK